MIEHRLDALERHVDKRLGEIEAKVDELLRRLESRPAEGKASEEPDGPDEG